MTDSRRQGDEVGGGGKRRRARVTVDRNGAGEPASENPATVADERARGETDEAAGGRPLGETDDAAAAGPAAVAGERSRSESDDVAVGAAGAGEDVSDEVEALVAEACIAELAKAEAERDAYLDQLQRLKAEFDNYRKRLQREGEALRLRAAEGLVESLLPVVDNMERALEAAGKHEESKLVEGVELVSGQLRSVLASQGLEEVPAEPGVPFDPTVHEAVLAQESAEYPEGTIAAVLEKGYLLHGRLLRPVKVIVAR